jgi:uncharacterized protein (DUF2249 family)
MQSLTIASTQADAESATTIEQHHAELAGSLQAHVQALLRAVDTFDDHGRDLARTDLVTWCRRELLPHALAEEATLYDAARSLPELEPLLRAMIQEHGQLQDLINDLAATPTAAESAATAGALQALFGSHVLKENELLLPALASATDVSLADQLTRMHREMTAHQNADDAAADTSADRAEHTCGCHDTATTDHPELDARLVPHAIRHATIFGALDAVAVGSAMVLVAPHDPIPLLHQIQQRHPNAFEVDYLERGPEAWRLLFTRSAA